MSDPWAEFRVNSAPAPKAENDPWAEFKPAQQSPPKKVFSGSILPISRYDNGEVSFDSDAGLLGTIKRAISLPGEVYRGEINPLSDEGIGRAFEMGSTFAPVGPGARAAEAASGYVGTRPAKVATPSADALKTAGAQGYDAVRQMSVDYSSKAVADTAAAVQRDLESKGIIDVAAPNTFEILRRLQSPPEGSVAPLTHLEAARRAFGEVASAGGPESKAAMAAKNAIHDFIAAADPKTVVAGPATEAGRVIAEARGNYAAGMRSEGIDGITENAELRAAAANSGRNLDNSVRQKIASLLIKDQDTAGFTPEELAQLELVVRGTKGANVARYMGNALGGGGGLGQFVTGALGASAGSAYGPVGAAVGAAVPAVGYAAKSVANALTGRGVRAVSEATRQRSPLFEQTMKDAPLEMITPEGRAAVVRALLAAQAGPNGR